MKKNDIVEEVGDFELVPQLLNILQIETDIAYQRYLNKYRVSKIAKNLNMLAFGCPVVAKRKDGRLFVVDGQQRLAALQSTGTKLQVWCMVFESKGQAQEAGIFLILNRDRLAVSSVARFDAALVAEDPATMEIVAVLKRYDIRVTSKAAWASVCQISCPGTLYKLNQWRVLQDTLATIWAAFEKADEVRRPQALHTGVIGSIGYIFQQVPEINMERLANNLEQINFQSWHAEVGGSSGARDPRYAKYLIDNFYNKRLQNKIDTSNWVK